MQSAKLLSSQGNGSGREVYLKRPGKGNDRVCFPIGFGYEDP